MRTHTKDKIACLYFQMFVNHLLESGYEIGKEYETGSISLRIQRVNLTHLVLDVRRNHSSANNQWNVQYALTWRIPQGDN